MEQCPPVAAEALGADNNGTILSLAGEWMVRPAVKEIYDLAVYVHVICAQQISRKTDTIWLVNRVCDFLITGLLILLLIYNVTLGVNLAACHL